jgi:multidrug efflux pump subunit AcrB
MRLHRLAAAGREDHARDARYARRAEPGAHAPHELSLDVDSQKAALLGVPAVEFDRAVRLAVAGIPAGRFKDSDGEQYDIMVRTPIDARPTCARSIRFASRRSGGETLAARAAGARRVQLRAH